MKRVFQILLIGELILISLASLFISTTLAENKLLYKETFSFSLVETIPDQGSFSLLEEKLQGMVQLAEKYNLSLTRIIWQSDEDLSLYSTDPSLQDRLEIETLLAPLSDNFLSNYNSPSEKAVGHFNWVDNNKNVSLYTLGGLKNIGIEGIYYVHRDSGDNWTAFQHDLQEQYDITISQEELTTLGDLQILKAIFTQPALFMAIVVLTAVTVFSLLFLYIQDSKKVALQTLTGYSFKQVIRKLLEHSIAPLLTGSILGVLIASYYFLFTIKSFLSLAEYFLLLATGVLFVALALLLISWGWYTSFTSRNSFHDYIKEKRNVVPLMTFSKLFQLLFLLLLPTLVLYMHGTIHELQEKEQANEVWEKARNVYATSIQYITSDYMQRRPYEFQIKNFYNQNQDYLALMDASNYDYLSSRIPLYEANTESKKEELTSPNGRSVYVNLTYLQWNQIIGKDGKPITEEDLNFEEDSFNILVPEKLQEYSEEIKENFQKEYIFQTYTIPHDIYGENTIEKTPHINLIYVKDNQAYFTYKDEIKGDENNLIVDPIAVVDIGNLDASKYNSWMSGTLYFQGEEGKSGFESILPSLKEENVTNQIQLVTPIYHQRAKEIATTKKMLYSAYFLSFLLFISFIFCLFYFYYALVEKNQEKLTLKMRSGYSLPKIYFPLFFLSFGLDGMILFLSSLIQGVPNLMVISLSLLTTEAVIFLFLMHKNKNINMGANS